MDEINKFLTEPILINGCLHCFLSLSGNEKQIKAIFDLEEEIENISDYNNFVIDSTPRLKRIEANNLKKLKQEIAIQLTDGAYSQSDYKPTEEDYLLLEQDLGIIQINIYTEDLVIEYLAKENYPDMNIYCQIDDNIEVVDLIVE